MENGEKQLLKEIEVFNRVSRKRSDELIALRSLLHAYDASFSDRQVFTRLFCLALHVLELGPSDLGSTLSASQPTISRWLNGVTTPAKGVRPLVFSALSKQVDRKLARKSELLVA